MRVFQRWWLRIIIGVVLLTSSSVVATVVDQLPASASTGPTYLVTVYANTPYGQPPTFQTRVSPNLPSGASLGGSVSCTKVTNSSNQLLSIFPPSSSSNTLGLDAGLYNIIPNDCTSTLSLQGTSGSLQLLGGPLVISPDQTSMVGAGEESKSTTNPEVVLSVAVVNQILGGAQMPNVPIVFAFQNSGDIWVYGACSVNGQLVQTVSTSAVQANGTAPALCILTGSMATEFLGGTGLWTAGYAGSTDYLGSGYSLQLNGAVSAAVAAENLSSDMSLNKIHIVTTKAATISSCHPSGGSGDSIFGASLSALNCTQLMVLQTLIGVIPVVMTAGAGIIVALAPSAIEGAASAIALGGRLGAEAVYGAVNEFEDFGEEVTLLKQLPTLPT